MLPTGHRFPLPASASAVHSPPRWPAPPPKLPSWCGACRRQTRHACAPPPCAWAAPGCRALWLATSWLTFSASFHIAQPTDVLKIAPALPFCKHACVRACIRCNPLASRVGLQNRWISGCTYASRKADIKGKGSGSSFGALAQLEARCMAFAPVCRPGGGSAGAAGGGCHRRMPVH